MFQKLKASSKFFSVGVGLFSSYFFYQYQQDVVLNETQISNSKIAAITKWLHWKSANPEEYLIQCCKKVSMSPFFHQAEMTSFLIYLANSRNVYFHDLGVKLLAVVQFPDDVDFSYYIKKCNHTALIGLARMENTNLRWFQHVRCLPENEKLDTEVDLSTIKQRLDVVISKVTQDLRISNNKKDCSLLLHQKVMYYVPDDPTPSMMSDFCPEQDSLSLSNKNISPFRKNIFTYLEILRRYSNNPTVAGDNKLAAEILSTLQIVIFLFRNEQKVQLACGTIIGNLAMHENNRRAIVELGLLTSITKWKFGDVGGLQIIADRILYNLDGVHNNHALLPDGLYILHPTKYLNRASPDVDIVFVHGIHGSPFHTWRQSGNLPDQTQCWPKDWVPKEFPNSRIICVQYESSLSDWFRFCPKDKIQYSIDTQAENIKKKLQHIGVGERPVVWVCHSMGGIIVKKILLSSGHFIKDKSDDILGSTKGILFYSVPHLGSPIASQSEKVRYILFPSVEVNELSSKGSKLKKLHSDFMELKDTFQIECVDFGESRPLALPYIKLKLMVVPESSCNVGYGRFILLDGMNHAETCKPLSKNDQRYTEVITMVHHALHTKNNDGCKRVHEL